MGERTAIQWTQATWNPFIGCTKVSPGCAHCYMFREQRMYGNDPTVVRRSKTKFAAPLRMKEPRLIFTCSWSDWFHPEADAWRPEAWEIIRRTPQHTYQILTKRPERIAAHLPADWGQGYPNVWLGVSIENQRYDYRAALLCQHPAAVRFVSAEPLLGRLRLTRVNPWEDALERAHAEMDDRFLGLDVLAYPKHAPLTYTPGARIGRIDWVIVGGESGGHEARALDLAAVRDLRDQCRERGVAFFVKQLGSVWARGQRHMGREDVDLHAGNWDAWPDDLRVREMPDSYVYW